MGQFLPDVISVFDEIAKNKKRLGHELRDAALVPQNQERVANQDYISETKYKN